MVASTTDKIAVDAPMPSARVTIAAIDDPRCLKRCRTP
jgi:hypothetical protein